MDEASKLVAELQSKLAELDQRVWQYRRDMTTEFDKYAESLLRDVPQDVSETVSKCLAESMKGYSSLYPSYSKDPFESCATTSTGTHILSNGDKSPQQPHVTSAPISFLKPAELEEDLPRSPHAREQEFRGVFTPNYLPLLDSTNRNERRPSSDTLISPPPGRISPQPRSMDPLHVDASTDTRSLLSTPETTRPPTPRRRNTDEVSVGSDLSEGGSTRRSALRRSSSSTRQSPRRVRFEVAGEEVLPTASPRDSRLVLAEEIPTTLGEMMGEEIGSEQIEDVDELPPPKRISSSQALRALSRSPLVDDGTTWTTVTAPPDGSASVATTNGTSDIWKTEDEDDEVYASNGISQPVPNGILKPHSNHQTKKSELADEAAGESGAESDDDLLDMQPLKRQPPPTTSILQPIKMAPPTTHPDISKNKTPTASTRPSRAWKDLENINQQASSQTTDKNAKFAPSASDDEEEMFTFDENEKRPLPPAGPEDEEYDDFDTDAPPVSPISKEPLSKFSSSPARDITRSSPPVTPASKGIVGSFKGHPFSLPIVSPDIHAQAASLGDISTFVGSVDGRSGVDESDVKSFRLSGGIGSFSGTPKSMSERMMFEDLKKGGEGDKKKVEGIMKKGVENKKGEANKKGEENEKKK